MLRSAQYLVKGLVPPILVSEVNDTPAQRIKAATGSHPAGHKSIGGCSSDVLRVVRGAKLLLQGSNKDGFMVRVSAA